ncbi:MAG: hypothetical protein M5U22_20155 [Thermoleophilia bacterium]|nr:hypothetical protein [Thermoleophilia bacterium]
MNFYWRQTIVGLLRHASDRVPALAQRCRSAADQLDKTLTTPWLEEAFTIFQEAALHEHDPVYVTGAYYAMQALEEVTRWEERAGGPVHVMITREGGEYALPGGPAVLPPQTPPRKAGPRPKASDAGDEVSSEVERGILELFDRIRRGATLEEALALFPHLGDEAEPRWEPENDDTTESP